MEYSIADVSFDGTFYEVPKLFYQLFTVFIQEQHHAFPAIHILMSSKHENLYTVSGCLFHHSKAIWKKVKKLQLSSTYSSTSIARVEL